MQRPRPRALRRTLPPAVRALPHRRPQGLQGHRRQRNDRLPPERHQADLPPTRVGHPLVGWLVTPVTLSPIVCLIGPLKELLLTKGGRLQGEKNRSPYANSCGSDCKHSIRGTTSITPSLIRRSPP